MLLRIVVSFASLCSLGFCLTPEQAYRKWLEVSCERLVRSLHENTRIEDLNRKTLERMASLYGSRPNFGNDPAGFRRVALDYLAQEWAKGRAGFLINNEVFQILDVFFHNGMTAADLQRRMELNLEESAPLLALPAGERVPFTLEVAGVKTRAAEIAPILEFSHFSGVPLFAIGSKELLRIAALQVTGPTRAQTDFTNAQAAEQVLAQTYQSWLRFFEVHGVYYAMDGEPAGVLIPRCTNVPAMRSSLVHELTHLWQDGRWDLEILLQFYIRLVRPHVDKIRGQLFASGSISQLANHLSYRFFQTTLYPTYRQSIIDSGDRFGMNELDWLIYMEMLTLISEIEARTNQRIAAEENGLLLPKLAAPNLQFGAITDYVRVKQISPLWQYLVNDLNRGSYPLSSLIKDLNAMPREAKIPERRL